MDVLLDCEFAVAHKDRLYRCLEQHLTENVVLVDVEFDTTDGRSLTLPRITIPEKKQAARASAPALPPPASPCPRPAVKHVDPCVADLGRQSIHQSP